MYIFKGKSLTGLSNPPSPPLDNYNFPKFPFWTELNLIIFNFDSYEAKRRRPAPPGLQKVGTAGTAGAGQITFGWTK